MNTLLSYLAVLALAAAVLAPSLYGLLRDHRTDQQIRTAARRRVLAGHPLPRQRRSAPAQGGRGAVGPAV